MLKKTFIQCMFGSPHSWIEPYLAHFGKLEASGWYMKIFSPNTGLPTPPNIEIVPMTVEEYDELLFQRTGVKAGNFLKNGVPSKLISDHYCAWGQVFQGYIKDSDFWAITNFDIVYGRLSKFLPDSELAKFDVWSDDAAPAINGIFSLFRNDEKTNNLFRYVPDWQTSFTVHRPCAFDEYQMTATMRRLAAEGITRWGYPEHFPMHSYDRLVMHRPEPHVYFEDDGALIEWYEDAAISPPGTKRHYGRELPLFHFSRTKKWPVGRKPA